MKRLVNRSRRQLLSLLVGLGVALPCASLARLTVGDYRSITVENLTGLLSSESAHNVGRAYLLSHPREAYAEVLLGNLPPALLRAAARPPHTVKLGELFSNCCRDDFANGRTTVVHGWMVSQTEARVCALSCIVDHAL